MITVAIANDTLMALEALRRAIATDPAYQLIWTAKNGSEAIALAESNRPDLILMDLLMPGVSGVEATRQIMMRSPCAILIVTGSVRRNTSKVFEAMGHGALDVVQTPVMSDQDMAAAAKSLLAKMVTVTKLIGKYKRHDKTASDRSRCDRRKIAPPIAQKSSRLVPELIVMGASTGGPKALAKILSQLPTDFAAAIVIVQHIDRQFTAGLARWLNGQSVLPVALAKVGDRPQSGRVLLAQADGHLIMKGDCTLTYTQNVPTASSLHRPSVDVFFHSVVAHWGMPGKAILLTGMGRDGAAGLGALRTAGWQTIAESQQSCVVYGMPRIAIENGAAISILAVEDIAQKITRKNDAFPKK